MAGSFAFVGYGVLLGIGGSACIDLWSLAMRRLFHVRSLDYAMLGRWIGHFRGGQFTHARIISADRVRGERPLGWVAHYGIGIAFAFVLLGIVGVGWVESPTLFPALLVGLATVLAPWLVMQPAFGMGIAGSRTPNPVAGRFRNLGTHTAFGVGLYVSAVILSLLGA